LNSLTSTSSSVVRFTDDRHVDRRCIAPLPHALEICAGHCYFSGPRFFGDEARDCTHGTSAETLVCPRRSFQCPWPFYFVPAPSFSKATSTDSDPTFKYPGRHHRRISFLSPRPFKPKDTALPRPPVSSIKCFFWYNFGLSALFLKDIQGRSRRFLGSEIAWPRKAISCVFCTLTPSASFSAFLREPRPLDGEPFRAVQDSF